MPSAATSLSSDVLTPQPPLSRPPAARLAADAADARHTRACHAARPAADTPPGLLVCSAAAYVPRRVAQLFASPAPPCPPCCAPLRAVLLFADISGYSRLTRWMSKAFEQGPWATGQTLNTLFGALVTCVEARVVCAR